MLIEKIKEQIKDAMKNKDNAKRDILKVALGEIQTFESRQGKINEDECIHIIRKIITDNEQMIGHYVDNFVMVDKFKLENKILQELLPKILTVDEIISFLRYTSNSIILKVLKASSDGTAIGIVMKYYKSKERPVNGKDVAEAVKKVRKEAIKIIKEVKE